MSISRKGRKGLLPLTLSAMGAIGRAQPRPRPATKKRATFVTFLSQEPIFFFFRVQFTLAFSTTDHCLEEVEGPLEILEGIDERTEDRGGVRVADEDEEHEGQQGEPEAQGPETLQLLVVGLRLLEAGGGGGDARFEGEDDLGLFCNILKLITRAFVLYRCL